MTPTAAPTPPDHSPTEENPVTRTTPTRTDSTARRFLRWFDQHTLEVFNPPVVRLAAQARRESR